jgi:hypothetical protein
MDAKRFRALSAHQRALVAVAVLLDGIESGEYLETDAVNGQGMKRAAVDLAGQHPELRMPYLASMLRAAMAELDQEG